MIPFLVRFFKDKYNVDLLNDVANEPTLLAIISETARQIGNVGSKEETNIRVLSTVKETLKGLMNQKQVERERDRDRDKERVKVQVLPQDATRSLLLTDDGTNAVINMSDQDLMDSIKKYEFERRQLKESFINDHTISDVEVVEQTVTNRSTNATTNNSTRTEYVIINGYERNFADNPNGSTIVWSPAKDKPIPQNVIMMSIDTVVLPALITSTTPFIILKLSCPLPSIKPVSFICFPTGEKTDAFAYYRPLHQQSALRLFAFPWSIQLFDAYEQPLNMLDDVKVVGRHIHNFYPVRPLNVTDWSIGDRIIVDDRITKIKGISRSAEPDTTLVQFNQFDQPNNVDVMADTPILNLMKQVTIVMSYSSYT